MNPYQKSRIKLEVDITDWTPPQRERCLTLIEEIDAANASRPTVGPPVLAPTDEIETSGWTVKAYSEVMTALLQKYFAQALVINEAIDNQTGFVSRDRVYELAGYPQSRSLKGFTRPVNRLVGILVERGDLPGDVEELLTPVYDPDVSSYQRTSGFTVPLEVVRMMLAQKAAIEEAKGA